MLVYQTDLNQAKSFLFNLFRQNATPVAQNWLSQKLTLLDTAFSEKDFYLAFSAVPRFTGKTPLQLTAASIAEADQLRTGFSPANWTVDQLARTLLLLALPHEEKERFLKIINQLYNTADMGELVALYASLPLLPYPEAFKARAAEGIRTNIGSVFEAIALHNPYPADYLEEGAWNQLVLKTIFTGKPLFKIYGLEKRSNPALARMLSDYAHERWAAGRTVTPELWRPVGPFIEERLLQDIKRLFAEPAGLQHEAAALACYQSNSTEAKNLLNDHPQLKQSIENNEITWELIGTKNLAVS